ncbi:copper resistance protein CopC [Allostreptomyces psammosilenae]|uniref:Protein YobA n=1 Tax=Allostreptomyces psammosilenae TaxID=1892865 RepID=A0A852ZUB5_9ACTN|nr:copper resistance protein CopC [Allostreptomyces psammosilenae]NYI05485.1 copper transport protein [Allostreptomyces psammosilenae]
MTAVRVRAAGPAPAAVGVPTAGRGTPGWAGRRVGALLGAVLAALALLFATAPPAAAHAELIGSDPAAGTVLDSAPSAVTLSFSEGVELGLGAVRVLDPAGEQVDAGTVEHADGDPATARVALTGEMPQGTYTVAWRVGSADAHVVSGAFTFSVGAASQTAVDVSELDAQQAGAVVTTAHGLARGAAFAGWTGLVGAGAFVLLCWPRAVGRAEVRRLLLGSWATLLAGSLAVLLLQGARALGGGLGDAFDLDVLRTTLDTRLGAALALRVALLALAAAWLSVLVAWLGRPAAPAADDDTADGTAVRDGDTAGDAVGFGGGGGGGGAGRWERLGLAVFGGVLAVGLAATWALSGHASVGPAAGWAVPSTVLHLLAAGVWLGGLLAVLLSLRHPADVETARTVGTVPADGVARFSRLAFGCVVVLAVSGLFQGWRQTASWDALFGSEYGLLLIAKTVAVLALVAVAALSRRWTARLRTAPTGEAAPSEATPDGAARTGPAHDETAHDETAHDETAHDETAHDETAHDETAQDETAQDETADADTPAPPASTADPRRRAQLALQERARREAAARRRDLADPGREGLRRSVGIEVVIAAVVLVLTTLLTGSDPGRTEAAAAPAVISERVPYDTGGENGSGTATVTVDPGRSGANTVHVVVEGADGLPVDVPELRLTFTLPEQDLGPLPVELEKVDTGHWTATGATLPVAGEWTMAVTVRTSDIDQVTERRTVEVR